MAFDTEHEMKEVASDVLPDAFSVESSEVLTEFDYGPGRADLVFANISEKYKDRRVRELGIQERITSKDRLRSFLHIHGKGEITREYFYSIGAMDKREKKDALNWLIENRFVRENDSKIRTASTLRRHVTTTISVELKLSKWRKALQQAQRGKSFANYRYVVLDEANSEPAVEAIKEFEERNVGLISVGSDGDFDVVNRPNRIQPYSELNRWKLNERTLQSTSPNIAAD